MPLTATFRFFVVAVFTGIICMSTSLLIASGVQAQQVQNEVGLSISPSRKAVNVKAGTTSSGHIIVTNKTQDPMPITMSYGEFSVKDHSYDYVFHEPREDWIRFKSDTLELRPGQRQPVFFELTVPSDAAKIDRYFTLYASTTVEGAGIKSTMRVASMLFVTVDGGEARQSLEVNQADVPLFATGMTIPYSYDVKNTGNTYINGHAYVRISSWFGYHEETANNAILYIDSTRRFKDALRAPLLPGAYQLHYGYATEDGQKRNEQSTTVWYVPLWSLVLLLGVVWVIVWLIRKKT